MNVEGKGRGEKGVRGKSQLSRFGEGGADGMSEARPGWT